MLGILGMYARVRTKMRKELGGVSYSFVYSVPGIKKKKVYIRGLGQMIISCTCASESEISEIKEKNEQPGLDRF